MPLTKRFSHTNDLRARAARGPDGTTSPLRDKDKIPHSQCVRAVQNSDIDLASTDVIRDLAAASLVFVSLVCVNQTLKMDVRVRFPRHYLLVCVYFVCFRIVLYVYTISCNRRVCVCVVTLISCLP